MKAGSAQFTAKYKEIASRDGTNFENAQKRFLDVTHFAPVANKIKSATGIDMSKRSRAIQELIYSMAVQYGGRAASIFISAVGRDGNKLTDDQIIDRVMNRRAAGVNSDFASSSASVKRGVSVRIAQERDIYKKMQGKGLHLKSETDSGGVTGTLTNTKDQSSTKPKAKSSSGAGTSNTGGKSGSNADYDLDKICQFAVSNASKKSLGKCAEYVRKALQAGDNKKKLKGGMGHARDWVTSLPKIGWNKVGGSPQKGDIAWFPTGMSGYGHVCIYTGSVWVSDFVQRTVQPSSKANLEYHLYRAGSGYSNGSAVGSVAGATEIGDGAADDGASSGSEGTEDNKSAIEKAQDVITTGVAAIGDALFNNDLAKSAINFVNSSKVDKWNPSENAKGAVNMDGFDKTLYKQHSDFKYDYGKSGVDRNALFDRNAFGRQEGAASDLLGAAGNLGGIVRQTGASTDLLGNAGSLGGILRQEASPTDWLGQAGDLGGVMRQEASLMDYAMVVDTELAAMKECDGVIA